MEGAHSIQIGHSIYIKMKAIFISGIILEFGLLYSNPCQLQELPS
jgi:hypothetical protein